MFIQIDPRLRAEKMIRLCLPNNVNCSNEMFKILTSTKNHKNLSKTFKISPNEDNFANGSQAKYLVKNRFKSFNIPLLGNEVKPHF